VFKTVFAIMRSYAVQNNTMHNKSTPCVPSTLASSFSSQRLLIINFVACKQFSTVTEAYKSKQEAELSPRNCTSAAHYTGGE